jgi:D-amino-acid dehydrogenase
VTDRGRRAYLVARDSGRGEKTGVTDIIVLGAGMVGVSAAIHLRRRGHDVLLLDRREPGRETSYGNAGIIQAEAVRPRAFPRSISELWRTARGAGVDTRYQAAALPGYAAAFARYWWNSAPARHEAIVRDYAPLIHLARPEHAALIEEAGAGHLVRRKGWMIVYRSEKTRDASFAQLERNYGPYGVSYALLDAAALRQAEPDLIGAPAGALHWTDPWTISDPGALVSAYAALFERLGGRFEKAGIGAVRRNGAGWVVETDAGAQKAERVVVALGPWSAELLAPLGLRVPLFRKRGYHMHYGMQPGRALRNWVLDNDVGYLLAPMDKGVRLTTGAEFSRPDSPPDYRQLADAEASARTLIPLGERLEQTPWRGARPCTPDMKPIIGPATRHPGLWFAFGHAHHGFSLGPATGRLLAEAMSGEAPAVNLAPFSPARFGA